jgi:hypothetical protein
MLILSSKIKKLEDDIKLLPEKTRLAYIFKRKAIFAGIGPLIDITKYF